MKTKANRFLSLLLCCAMLLGLLPLMSITVFAAEPGISLSGADSDKSGTGWSYTASSQTLTLSGYNGGYIQGSGFGTLNLVLEGTSTITVDDTNAKGIALGNNQNLNISGSGSLTINATGGSNLIYGIECNQFTMTSGTVTINANSSKMVYGVNANSSLSVTGGKLTANITGTSDGRGLYCKTGKLTVGSGAEVAVEVTNNGSNNMYGLYNNAYTASVTDNGDIELAGTVTVTRDGGSTGSGMVYGIANGGSGDNTDGVIRVTGGSVTVMNAYYGIAAFTKGHDTAFADVDISGGTVNVTSTTSGSNGIISWNNGITISGGTVTAGTASSALRLVDSDSTNKTGLVKITGDAKVSLTSTNYKALIVDGDESNTSTRVHQINLTSGGSVTVKSTSSDEIYYTYPVQGYFNLGSSTKITEGSFRSTPDGTNAGGGKLFQSDNSTNQVVVAYSTPAPDANSVSVNGHPFAAPTKLYYKNGGADTGSDSTDYNAHYDPATGILELKNYNSGRIIIGGSVESDITIKLVGDNVINSDLQYGIVNNNGGDITITADSDATLTINVTDNSDNAHGIACDIAGSYASRSREITISGKAKVTVNATSTSSAFNDNAVGIFTGGKAAIVDDASFTAICKSSTPSGGLQSAAGIYGYSGVTINTTGKVDIDTSQCSGAYNYGIFGNSDKSHNRLEKVSDMTIKWKNGSSGAPVTPATSFDSAAATHAINVDTTNCVATYRYGTPYTVTVNNGSCDAAKRQYLEGDTVTVTADTISDLTFKKWSSADVTVANETNATTTFIMPGKDVTVTANYNLFTTEPSFARTSDTQGTISFTLAANPSGTPRLVEKDSDTLVGSQYFSGSTLDRSNTVTNGTGTYYDVPAGEYRIAVRYGDVWFYSDVFAVNYTGTPQASVDNTIVSGTTNQMLLNPVDVVITLQSDTFQGVSTNDNVESWFTNLPAGLTAVIRNVGSDAKTVTVRINGTPTEVKNEAMAITIPGEKLTGGAALTVTENANAKFNISAPTYTVTINAGANMTLASGNANQSGLSGAMTDTVYTAADGYYFPTDYTVAAVNGITVTRIDFTKIKVSGTPTAAANITLTAPTAKTKEATPTAVFTANGTDSGKLTGIAAGMKYRIGGGAWVDITATEANLTGLSACTITIMKSGNGTTTLDSDEQTITVTKAAKPALKPTLLTLAGGKGSIPTGTAHEFSTDGTAWTPCTGATENLDTGKYYVRVKANGTQLASETQEIDIFLYGDANGDGKVDIDDLTRLRKYFAELTTVKFPGADANGDGTVDIDDLTLLRKFIAEEAVVLGK